MENLEKRLVDYVTNTGRVIKGIVAGYDRDIGVTIVAKEDKNDILFCLVGPSSVQYKKAAFKNRDGEDERFFSFCTEAIKAGVFDTREYEKITTEMNNTIGSVPQERCAFST